MATGRIGTTPVLQVRWSKAPSDGTTSLSGLDDNSVSLVYSVGYEAVYRNGVLLSRGNDYTATDGTTVTLIDATITGDIIEIFANQTIPLSDTYSQTVSDGKFINNTLTTTTGDIIYASGANTPARLAIGTSADVLTVSGGIPAWAAPAGGGKVLQVVSGTLTASTSTNSTSYSDTGLSVSITPSAATSKILIFLNAPGAAAYAGTNQTDVRGLFRLVRTSTTINAGTIGIYNQASASSQNHTPPYFAYVDSPNTTSATTYKITYKSISASIDFYIQGLVTDSVASLILMEIGA
jgi:hypothetical protein